MTFSNSLPGSEDSVKTGKKDHPGATAAKQRIEVDLGCGLGHFLVARAARFPLARFVGIERKIDRVRRCRRKIERAELVNVEVIQGDAVTALSEQFPDGSIDCLFVLFPDPWPKRRHHRRRLLNQSFLDLLAKRLRTGGEIQIASDHRDYFIAVTGLFAADARYRQIAPTPRLPQEQTRFEQIFREQGAVVHETAYRMVAGA